MKNYLLIKYILCLIILFSTTLTYVEASKSLADPLITKGLKVVSVTPANKSKRVTKDTIIKITFNKIINAGPEFDSICLLGPIDGGYSEPTISDNMFTIKSAAAYDNTKYIVRLPNGAFKDEFGNLSKEYVFQFTTKRSNIKVAKPIVKLTSTTGKRIKAESTISASVTYAQNIGGGAAYYWDGISGYQILTGASNFNITAPTKVGKHTLYLRVVDVTGNDTGWKRYIYKVKR
ncbi:MAG TPA: hypothetical protein DEP72_06565 [Clostridiales bacterium]|nr:MAG: hypothetical protein A2Y18_03540 [Clostridiales bacterium GWD2_32_19]HCC07801.1 hypothetical protein [Clostridiales bacterium]